MSVPGTQTVLGARTFGGPHQLGFVEGIAVPQPRAGELLVQLKAAGVNPVDVHKLKQKPDGTPVGGDAGIFIAGWDGAGTVAAVGQEVQGFAVGDAVIFLQDGRKDGCYREWACVDYRLAAKPPAGSPPLTDLAALPLAGLTAWEGLFEGLQISPPGQFQPPKPTKTLLIVGGAGGVGTYAIQLAKQSADGIRVVATATTDEGVAHCRALGADEVVRGHDAAALTAALGKGPSPSPGVDYALNLGPPENLSGISEVLRPLGRVCQVGAGDMKNVDIGFFFFKRATIACETVFARSRWEVHPEKQGAALGKMLVLAAGGRLSVRPRVKSWRNYAEVLAEVGGRHTIGKWVFEIDSISG